MQLLIMKQDTPPHLKGDIVEIRATGTPFGGKEPDYFVMVEAPDVPMTAFRDYSKSWDLDVGFGVVGQDVSLDGYRIKLYSELINGTKGVVSRLAVESFINSWGGLVHSTADNEVVFDITIYDALVSEAFWDITVDEIIFSEVSYNESTGIHRIQADYSALANNPTYVEAFVERKGLTIISHADKVLVYDADRSIVREAFQRDIKKKSRIEVARRRYYINSGVVDAVIANGGTAEADHVTLLSYIKDKVA